MATEYSKIMSLDRLAARLRQQHAGNIAILVDLSAIPAIHSRIMFRSFARFIEERTIDEPIDAVPLARNILVMLAPAAVAQRIKEKLDALNTQLHDQRHGSIRIRQYDLESQATAFADTARRLMEQAPAPGSERVMMVRDEAPPDANALGDIINLHRILWQADLSNQTRRQPIWELVPNTAPAILSDETWISIAAIERATGVDLYDNMWLLAKATEMLDQRVISNLMGDTTVMSRPLSINLHLTSVIGTAFRKLLHDKPQDEIAQLLVEVPLLEWRINSKLSQTALHILRQAGVRLCLDGIQPDQLAGISDDELAAADFLKLDAAGGKAAEVSTALKNMAAERRELLLPKVIFCHCDNAAAVEAGLETGSRFFQGRGLTPLLEDTDAMERLLGYEAADAAVGALKGLQPSI